MYVIIKKHKRRDFNMKLLASDYDGTLYTDRANLRLNMKAINKFMNNGNKFAIVTGRSFESIKKEIEYYNIKYDYLACNNGLIIFDNKDNIINSSILSLENLNLIYDNIMNFSGVKDVQLYSFFSLTYSFRDVLEVYAKFKNINAAKECKKYIESNLSNISCYNKFNKLFICNNITKADAVSFIQHLHNIDKNNIYAVGDNTNDLEMLEKYNGYKMLFSYPSLLFKKIPTTREVHTLVKKINK